MSKDSKIKILFTISNFDTAGSGKVVYDLVKGLDKTKFHVEIVCGNNKGDFFKVIEELGYPIHILETKTAYRPYYSLLFRVQPVVQFYKKNNFDIIHSWQWSNDWTEALAARLAGKKWMYTKKAMGFNKHWKIKSYLAHFIVTINDEMSAYFPNKKEQALIPLGIDTDFYNPKLVLEQLEATNPAKFHIITVANLVPVKGIQILIEAVHKLQDFSIKLSILGNYDNDYGDAMIDLRDRLGMQEQIRFLGKQLDVRPYIVAANLYVIPTLDEGRKEGMPMALVEAMSMGIPVLGSDITGINYVLKDFKELLFAAGNMDALALKIVELQAMDIQTRLELGQKLRAYCEAHFTMAKFITAHEALYKTILYGK